MAKRLASLPNLALFPVFFAAVALAHLTLLRLPYFWDEAGYYIPAAWDFFRTGSLIPIELWELITRPPGRRLPIGVTFLLNLIIVWYLARLLRARAPQPHAPTG